MGLQQEAEKEKLIKEFGKDSTESRRIVHQNGPKVQIGLSLPILPCVLMVHNSYVIGSLWGKGQFSLFIFYGFGIVRVFEFTTWIS